MFLLLVLKSNYDYHRVDPPSTGFFDTVFAGYFGGHLVGNQFTFTGIFHDMCHFFSNVSDDTHDLMKLCDTLNRLRSLQPYCPC